MHKEEIFFWTILNEKTESSFIWQTLARLSAEEMAKIIARNRKPYIPSKAGRWSPDKHMNVRAGNVTCSYVSSFRQARAPCRRSPCLVIDLKSHAFLISGPSPLFKYYDHTIPCLTCQFIFINRWQDPSPSFLFSNLVNKLCD